MSQQIVVYKGVTVQAVERSGKRIRIQSRNPADAQKVGLTFKDLEGGVAVFEAWVEEDQLVAVDV
ncbi:hypothetical protein SCOR_21700 [Sulfidibacter corallicola]|uniref:Uncharacterized protein n=1 Tax=Sulfidibacter corallicola TaxID=2818388 RepID=A0A8A4TV04_SULCO|nr:hypothetical protein [Sulfidibacter corallicola]QTD52954.1 hypothetical protein J3U87_10845 [Sulfidibacter corallicola]